ncbi:MAG: hypothetical protein C0456_12320 [Hyphomonas sp.]|uniref:hypothetical protein n=1 Tax=Hyphomonas sp. TaxID=87 RepID=UPI001D9102A9|nr:hypothetical protein [Hyphomonas sp.]MBA4227407.1 hypothetical protein [Hyphomonas sp.]
MQEDSPPSKPKTGISRLNRRRRRIVRNQRHYGNKTTTGWAEYAPVTLTKTGDRSFFSQLALFLMGLGALILPIYIFVMLARSPDN